ncbi:hypothetical protein R1flu_025441 [Riccia fluitans]|uniref:Uncharacterized protein n=1 Tax=Riccia fluitans TaxID=41844 RepID=A0ABD1XXT4_9MARC
MLFPLNTGASSATSCTPYRETALSPVAVLDDPSCAGFRYPMWVTQEFGNIQHIPVDLALEHKDLPSFRDVEVHRNELMLFFGSVALQASKIFKGQNLTLRGPETADFSTELQRLHYTRDFDSTLNYMHIMRSSSQPFSPGRAICIFVCYWIARR